MTLKLPDFLSPANIITGIVILIICLPLQNQTHKRPVILNKCIQLQIDENELLNNIDPMAKTTSINSRLFTFS